MGDFSTGFGTGFEIGMIIKEKKKAKKALEEVNSTLQEWKISGKEPSYVDKVMLSMAVGEAGKTYADLFSQIDNNQANMDQEKLTQNAISLREYNAQVMNFTKMIQTSLEEGTIGLIDWNQYQALFPNIDLKKLLNKEAIEELKNKPTGVYTSPQEVQGAVPGAGYEYNATAGGYVAKEPSTSKTGELSAKDNWAIDNYKEGKISFDQLSKYMGAYIEPEKATELQKKIAEAKQYGASNDEIKKMIVGGGAEGAEKARVTSLPQLEEYRDKALNADSWEDAEKIINDYTEAGYDVTQLGVTKEAWANNKKLDLDNLVAVLDEITAGTANIKSKQEFTFNLDMGNGKKEVTKSGEEWYKQVYESYIALLKLLEEQGVDTSQYKKLKPLSEIKAGFIKGLTTFGGVGKGDLVNIYY